LAALTRPSCALPSNAQNLCDSKSAKSRQPGAAARRHLGSADLMVIRVRRRMLRALHAHAEGTPPPGVDEPKAYRQRSGGVVLPAGADWIESTRGLREGTEEPTLDPTISAGV
jgi:hypothetical protein